MLWCWYDIKSSFYQSKNIFKKSQVENKQKQSPPSNKTKKQKQKFPSPDRVIYGCNLEEFGQAFKDLK